VQESRRMIKFAVAKRLSKTVLEIESDTETPAFDTPA